MPTYVVLVELTEGGRERLDELSVGNDAFAELAGDRDVELRDVFLTMGRFDAVAIVEAPDGETLADVLVDYAGRGIAKTETMQAFPAEDFL